MAAASAPRAQQGRVRNDQGRHANEQIGGHDAAAGRLIVKLRDSAASSDLGDIDAQADADLDRPLANGRVRLLHSRSKSAAELLATLRRHQQIEYVEPDYVIHAGSDPDDPLFANQWGLNNTGQTVNGTAGVPGADVHATAAWTLARGSANTVIGIVDGAFDYTHFDLMDNVWSAPHAFQVHIGSFTESCPAGAHGALFEGGGVTCEPMYDTPDDHATHVAGIAGAAGNNAAGTAGASWHTSLMSLNFMPDGSTGFTSDAINAIEFAIQVKAAFAGSAAGNIRVLNNSWGSTGFSQSLQDEIDRAGANDILFVVAAGNSSANIDSTPYYPASLNRPNELSVAASAPDDSLAWFSNFSPTSVHLAAPGSNIFSTLPGGEFGYMSGTSMATPLVSGAAALVLSRCALDTADLKALLMNTVDVRPAFASTTASGGRLNIAAAVQACAANAGNAPPTVTLSAPVDGATYSQGQAVTVSATAADSDGSIARVDFYAGSALVGSSTGTPYSIAWRNAAPGTYTLTALATDDGGAQTRSDGATLRIGAAGAGSLPSPWQHADVGSVGIAGDASYSSGTFTVHGAGGGMASGAGDAFHFVYQPLTANGQIVVRVTSLPDTGSSSQAGVTMRGGVGAGASEAVLDVRGDGTVELTSRQSDGQNASLVKQINLVAPEWLKLARLDRVVFGYASADGTHWMPLGKVFVDNAPSWVGFGVSSDNTSFTDTATFDSVAVVGGAAPSDSASGGTLPAPWISSEVGATGQAGGASMSSGTFTVAGAGSDVWGTSDSFQYVNQNASGDFTLTARIATAENTNVFAKAGIMLRDSLAADAANVILDIRPTGDVEFMTRAATGASETVVGSVTQQLPGWVRLVRTGSGVTARVSADGNTWTTVGTTTFALPTSLAGLIVCSHTTSALDTATFDNVSITPGTSGATLPSPWTSTDIGATGQAGRASASNGVFTVSGAGADVWGAADSFQYVSQPVSGDFSIVARITSEQNTAQYAKAGVMLRGSLAANAANVILDMVPGGDFEFMTRAADGANETFLAGAHVPLPAWVRLTASGGAVTASVSPDGSLWTTLGSTSFASSGAFAGLLVCSHTTASLNTATFDNVSVAGAPALPSPWVSSDVGQTGVAGSATFVSGAFTVRGGGADIWGDSDGFQFVNQGVSGDFTLTARVSNQTDTNTYAKAGIMLRNSLSSTAANVLLDMRPGGDVEFMTRAADGGSEAFLAGTTLAAPAWVRLDRTGSTVTASVSADGTAWTAIGSVTFTPASALAGLIVCSHTTSTLSSATFDSVSFAAGEP